MIIKYSILVLIISILAQRNQLAVLDVIVCPVYEGIGLHLSQDAVWIDEGRKRYVLLHRYQIPIGEIPRVRFKRLVAFELGELQFLDGLDRIEGFVCLLYLVQLVNRLIKLRESESSNLNELPQIADSGWSGRVSTFVSLYASSKSQHTPELTFDSREVEAASTSSEHPE